MTYVLAHVDDPPRTKYDWRKTDPELDVSILLPGTKICTIVPIAALRLFLPMLDDLLAEHAAEPLRCECCGEVMDVPIVMRDSPPLQLGSEPFELGAAIARELGEE